LFEFIISSIDEIFFIGSVIRMAVQGAHLTSTVSHEDDTPSIFEVLAQESLVHTLRPTLHHLLRVSE